MHLENTKKNVLLPSLRSGHADAFLSVPNVKSRSDIKKENEARIERARRRCYEFDVQFLCSTGTIEADGMFLIE